MPEDPQDTPESSDSNDTITPARSPSPPAPPAKPADTGYTPSGIPTFDSVREKIETRYGTAIGSSELAAETPEGRTVEKQYEERQKAAAERLEQIRESMGKDKDENS